MKEILENAEEFLASGEDNLKKNRWNAAVSDFFKAISNFCDYLIYKEIKIITKNHNERFNLLKKYFGQIYQNMSRLFKIYRDSYNLRLKKEDAQAVRNYAHEIKDIVAGKK
jgi:uncharacterized protein (UPF0332 family)